MRTLGRIVIVAAAMGAPRPALAHPVPFSFLDLRLSGNVIEGARVAHNFDPSQ